MSKINEDFLPIYQKVSNWITTFYRNNTNKWLDKDHANEIYEFLYNKSKFKKQDGTAAIITKFLEASLEQEYVKVSWTESSLRSMVFGDKVR